MVYVSVMIARQYFKHICFTSCLNRLHAMTSLFAFDIPKLSESQTNAYN